MSAIHSSGEIAMEGSAGIGSTKGLGSFCATGRQLKQTVEEKASELHKQVKRPAKRHKRSESCETWVSKQHIGKEEGCMLRTSKKDDVPGLWNERPSDGASGQ